MSDPTDTANQRQDQIASGETCFPKYATGIYVLVDQPIGHENEEQIVGIFSDLRDAVAYSARTQANGGVKFYRYDSQEWEDVV